MSSEGVSLPLPEPPPLDPNISYALAYLLQAIATPKPDLTYHTEVPEAAQNGAETAQLSDSEKAPVRKRRRAKAGAYKYLRPDEVIAVRKAINTDSITGLRNRCIFDLWYRAGLRISEVCALAPHHVDIDGGEISIFNGKGGKDRVAYFDQPATSPLLESWLRERKRLGLAGAPTLFCTIRDSTTRLGGHVEKGRPVSRKYLQVWLKRMCRQAGLDERRVREITPHKLRHTWATEYYREKRDIIQIKEQLGHERLETTMVYTHIVDGDRKASIQKRQDPLAEERR